jgi:hypothetical protein
MFSPGYGTLPRVKSSQRTTPYDHTSDWVEKTRSVRDSMAIHLTGINPYEYRNQTEFIFFYTSGVASLYQNACLACLFVIVFVVHFLGHAEIGHFCHSVVGQQNISRGQIAMEDLKVNDIAIVNRDQPFLKYHVYLFASQIIHPSSYLIRPGN